MRFQLLQTKLVVFIHLIPGTTSRRLGHLASQKIDDRLLFSRVARVPPVPAPKYRPLDAGHRGLTGRGPSCAVTHVLGGSSVDPNRSFQVHPRSRIEIPSRDCSRQGLRRLNLDATPERNHSEHRLADLVTESRPGTGYHLAPWPYHLVAQLGTTITYRFGRSSR